MSEQSVLERLRVPFPAEQVKKNQDGLDYVSIDGYINRLLDVLELDYDFVITQSSVTLLPEDMKTRSGKRQYLAQVTAQLLIRGPGMRLHTTRSGVGADVAFDADKAIKTAQAEALKKAAHQFGIALELWDEEHRDALEAQREILKSETAMKREVFRIAKERFEGDGTMSAKDVAAIFEVEIGDLADKAKLKEILEKEGVL